MVYFKIFVVNFEFIEKKNKKKKNKKKKKKKKNTKKKIKHKVTTNKLFILFYKTTLFL